MIYYINGWSKRAKSVIFVMRETRWCILSMNVNILPKFGMFFSTLHTLHCIRDLHGVVEIQYSFLAVLLNLIHPKARHIINLLCLILKQLIYWYKCKKVMLYIRDSFREIQIIQNIELYIARSENRTFYHFQK